MSPGNVQVFGPLLSGKFVTKNFQKSPNLVTLGTIASKLTIFSNFDYH